jgi:hypothetical protein
MINIKWLVRMNLQDLVTKEAQKNHLHIQLCLLFLSLQNYQV